MSEQVMNKRALDSAHRQMGAVIAKAMEKVEGMEAIRSLHPLEFDALRRLMISFAWDSYNIGLTLGKKSNDDIYGS